MFSSIKFFLSTNWEWFKSFFSEETGPSTTRALNWIWVVFLASNLTFICIFNAIQTHKAELPPIESASGYVAITALLLSAKVGQRIWGENPVTGQESGSYYKNIIPYIAAQYSSSYMTGSVVPTPLPTPVPVTPQPYVPIPVPITSSVDPNPQPLPQPTVLPPIDPNNP